MRKLILNLIFLTALIFTIFLFYFSFFGIKTKNFNSQIEKTISEYDKNLSINLSEVFLRLNIKQLNIEVKTLNPIIKLEKKKIEIDTIKSLLSLKAFLKKEFALKNLYISTKSNKIKDIIDFIKLKNNFSELYLLQNKIQKGNLIANIVLNFDKNGDVKDNFEINGKVRDASINLISNQNLSNINFLFEFKKDNYKFLNLETSFNNLDFFSRKISIIEKNNNFLVDGDLENKNVELDKEQLSETFIFISNNRYVDKLNFNSKNNFSFRLNSKFKIKDLTFDSNVKLKELILINEKKGKYFLPEVNDEILIKDHDININFKNKNFFIKGSGDILLQKKIDKINYNIDNKDNYYQFETTIELTQNPFVIEFLNYEKEKLSNSKIRIIGRINNNKEINFKKIEIKENKNLILFKNIHLDKDFKIISIDKINLDFIDANDKKNQLNLIRNKNIYNLKGDSFNADWLVSKLLEEDDDQENKLFKKDFLLNLKIDQIYLDEEESLSNLSGNLEMIDNKIKSLNLNSAFQNNEKFTFSINSKNDQTITTLFSEKAEPLVKRYDFIKGFEEGTLDFYSTKTGDKSSSILRIFDFKLQELPALTKLLTLASLQGIADTLTGEGIRFNELEMQFSNAGNSMTIDELYAIGPAISVLMSGYIEKDNLVSLRGTLVPATTLNKTIGSIPILGKILVGSKTGEGVFGVSFKIKGHPENLETTVNPIKTLTPRFITRTLEKLKKN